MTEQERRSESAGSLLDVALGVGAPVVVHSVAAARVVVGFSTSMLRGLLDPPLPAGVPRPVSVLGKLAARGREARHSLRDAADNAASTLVPAVLSATLDHVDLTQLLSDHVDLNELALSVVDGIDLPGLIRESSLGVTAEAVRGVRIQGFEADQAVARVVDRVLLRRRGRQIQSTPVGSHPNGDGPETP